MTEQTFAQKTLDKLLEVVDVEFKIPLGIAEIKFPATEVAKNWWENKKSRLEVEEAIQRAEEKFISAHPENRLAQILHDFPLYSDDEYRNVILGLLTHLDEEKITWLAQVKIEHEWDVLISRDEIRSALELYLPYLRHELNGIREFREIITARMLERIDQRTETIEEHTLETVESVRRIETKLDIVLDSAPKKQEPDYWYIPHPYPRPPNFTGRKAELEMLDAWLADDKDRLFIFRALGGFGKSALAWQWITTHVKRAKWKKIVWWSFYEGDASFENFIEDTLKYLKLEVPRGQRPQVDTLLKAMQRQKILLIMDGFERALRAYSNMNAVYQGDEEPKLEDNQLDCVNLNAEIFLKSVCALPNVRSKVLMTTRLTPRTVKPRGEFMLGCHEVELTAMQKEDAVEFFRRQGVKGTRAEIEAACAPYGYHPLSLRLLAGRILKDFENPADIVVAQKLKIDGDLKAHQHHVLEISYSSLPPQEQTLLSTIACFRSPVELNTLKVVAKSKDTLDTDLHNLVECGLLQSDTKAERFDLHPIVRYYAYECLTPEESAMIHGQLADYFATIPVLSTIEKVQDLAVAMELYHHSVKAGQLSIAYELFLDQLEVILSRFGYYQTGIELLRALFLDGDAELPSNEIVVWDLGEASWNWGGNYHEMFMQRLRSSQAWVLNELGNCYSMVGEPHRAVDLYEQKNNLHHQIGDNRNLLVGLFNVAYQQISIGELKDAETNLYRAINLKIGGLDEATCIRQLCCLHSYKGEWEEARQKLQLTSRFESEKDVTVLSREPEILQSLLLARNQPTSRTERLDDALRHANQQLELVHMGTKLETGVIETYWELGSALRALGQTEAADQKLIESLGRCRAINLVNIEANILLELARLRYDQKSYEEAKSLAEEALYITERCGYVLQGADVNLFLAQYALEQEKNKAKAKEYAETALKLAYCDGPPHYYKVAYEEAERMLERLK